jgi:hypothetical protein
MKRTLVQGWVDCLYKENYKSFYLAFLRVAISLWLLKEVFINWAGMDILYSPKSFVVRNDGTLFSSLPVKFSVVRDHYQWLIGVYIVVLLLNIAGIGRWVTAILLFLLMDTVHKLNFGFVNGGDILARLIVFYLVFANSYEYFVLFKSKDKDPERKKLSNLMSNLAAYSIMLQLCVAYLSSAIAKLHYPVWLNGEALYYTLSMERFVGTPLNHFMAQSALLVKIGSYATLAFELSFPFLIWVKGCRKPLLIAGVLFHLFIYIFLMIYGFQIVFVLTYGLFLSNEEVVRIATAVKLFFSKLVIVGRK